MNLLDEEFRLLTEIYDLRKRLAECEARLEGDAVCVKSRKGYIWEKDGDCLCPLCEKDREIATLKTLLEDARGESEVAS